MGLFSRRSDAERAADDAAEERAARSLAQIEAGGLPLNAEERLRELAGGASMFTSTLSVNGFAFCDLDGIRPITQVMGSSVYHVGFQWMPSYRRWGAARELETLSAAWNRSRDLALGRLRQEAALAGAHAVVGVRLTHGQHEFAGDAVEWIATGTAVAVPGEPVPAEPALTDLSVQDFWRLRRAGHRPVGVVGHTTVYYIVASYATQRAMQGGRFFGGGRNVELEDFTQGMYNARATAMASVHRQSQALGAEGVVGVEIDQRQRVHKVSTGNDSEREDLIVHLHVLGTAIADARADVAPADLAPATQPVLWL